MANIYDMVDVWNASGTTFTAIKMNVTDTASAAASNLLDLQVGGVSKFSVAKNGDLLLGTSTVLDGGFIRSSGSFASNSGIYAFRQTAGGSIWTSIGNLGILQQPSSFYAWASAAPAAANQTAGRDLILARDAAGTLAQRNGTNAQAFNLYNTFTDASNYERGFMKWNSNVLEIGTEAAGTGTNRSIRLITNGSILKTAGGQNYAIEAGSYIRYASGLDLLWSNNVNAHTGLTTDVGIARMSAGVLQITDGSLAATGAGELIFIVPTTDPGITGALWNNAGTLAISA